MGIIKKAKTEDKYCNKGVMGVNKIYRIKRSREFTDLSPFIGGRRKGCELYCPALTMKAFVIWGEIREISRKTADTPFHLWSVLCTLQKTDLQVPISLVI